MSPPRSIIGLKWARPTKCPWPKTRPRGTKALGLAYEKLVCEAFGAHRGIWFEFEDLNGRGFCSPDGLRPYQGRILVLECKLTDNLRAWDQLRGLYFPIIEATLGRAPLGLVICKNLTTKSDLGNTTGDPQRALRLALSGGLPLLHLPRPTPESFGLLTP